MLDGKPPVKIVHDTIHDIVTIEGLKYSGAFFRWFGGAQPGVLFEIVCRDDGVIAIKEHGQVPKKGV